MALTTDFNVDPYYDDYDEDKSFYRILFRPGYAVQAREVTQLQTILQSQVEKFGDNIIKNGSIVSGCSFTTSKINFVKLTDRDSSGDTYVITDFANGYIVHASSNLTFQTIDTKSGFEITNPDLNTLYGRYINSGNSSGVQKDEFSPGDTIKVGVKIIEGKRERIQFFEGVCIAKKNRDINSSFTVRKISFGEGVERTFALYSPNVDSIKVIRSGKVRRAKLYYLRDRKGKSARIAEKIKKKIGVDVSVKLEEPKAGPSAELKKEGKTNEEKKTPLKSETKTEKSTTEKK